MKPTLIILLCIFAFASTGCASLERAREIYENRAGQADEAHRAWSEAVDKLEEAEGDVRDFQRQWDALNNRVGDAEADLAAAVASGDLEAIKAAGDKIDDSKNVLKTLKDKADLVLGAVKIAKGHVDEAKEAYDATEKLAKSAAEDFESAKSTSDYIGTVLGYLGLGFMTLVGGGGGASAILDRRKRNDAEGAIRRVYKSNEAYLGEDDLKEVKTLNAAGMTPREREAARRATR